MNNKRAINKKTSDNIMLLLTLCLVLATAIMPVKGITQQAAAMMIMKKYAVSYARAIAILASMGAI